VNESCRRFRAALESELALGERAAAALGWHEHLAACSDCRELLDAEEALDVLLATLPQTQLEPGVAARLLSRLSAEREEAALDALLARWPEPEAPANLPVRVLAGLGAARRKRAAARPLLRVAAGLLIALGAVLGLRELLRAPAAPPRVVEGEPPAELLETLDLLESWETVTDDSLDVALTGFDEVDEILMQLERGGDPLGIEPESPAHVPPSEG
jgi:hypothetical protein